MVHGCVLDGVLDGAWVCARTDIIWSVGWCMGVCMHRHNMVLVTVLRVHIGIQLCYVGYIRVCVCLAQVLVCMDAQVHRCRCVCVVCVCIQV